MHIMICGASGLIGQALVGALIDDHQLTVVGRDASKLKAVFHDTCSAFTWEALTASDLADVNIVINLAGENIANKRWSASQKQEIIDSRVTSTRRLAEYCAALGKDAPRLMNASAIGIYGLQPTIKAQNAITYDEDAVLPAPPTDFLSQIGNEWEHALMPAEKAGVPVIKLRFSVVLTQKGGALVKMLPAFKLGLGAILGSGQQPFSWVVLDDLVSAILFLIDHPEATGVFNIVAEEVVTQNQFAKTLAKSLNKPCFLTMPSILVKILFGQMGEELLLNGQRVRAKRLREMGFHFRYDSLEAALNACSE